MLVSSNTEFSSSGNAAPDDPSSAPIVPTLDDQLDVAEEDRPIEGLDELDPIDGDDSPLGGELTLPESIDLGDPYDDQDASDTISAEPIDTASIEGSLADDDERKTEVDELEIPDDSPIDPEGDREGPAEDDPDLVPLDVVELDDDRDGLAEEPTLEDPDASGSTQEPESP